MKKIIALMLVTSLVGCSSATKESVTEDIVDVSSYNEDISNFVNITYNGGKIETKYINDGQVEQIVSKYNAQNKKATQVVDISDKMEVYMNYVEYKIDSYLYSNGQTTTNEEPSTTISDEFIDDSSEEENRQIMEMADTLVSLNTRINDIVNETNDVKLITEVHAIWVEYKSLPDYARLQVKIEKISDIINLYGDMENGFDLEKVLSQIQTRGNRFDADEDYSDYPEESISNPEVTQEETLEDTSSSDEPFESTEGISETPEVTISNNNIPVVQSPNSTEIVVEEIPESWYTECITMMNGNLAADRKKIAEKVGELHEEITYNNGDFKLDMGKLQAGLNNIEFPGGYVLEVVKSQDLNSLSGVEEYKYVVEDFLYWDNNTFKVRVVSKMNEKTFTGTYYNNVISFDNVDGILPHEGTDSINWNIKSE